MTVEEFRAVGIALFGYGWQSKLARELGIADRTVRKWVSGETPLPEWLETALGGINRKSADVPEWLTADNGQDPPTDYIVHLRPPRFICRVADDFALMEGTSFGSDNATYGELVWLDLPQPEAELRRWLEAAADWIESLPEV
jgi:hypothetical protein